MHYLQRFYQVHNRIRRYISTFPLLENLSENIYQAALETHRDKLPFLSPNDSILVDILKQDGIVITSLEALEISSIPLIGAAHRILPSLQNFLPTNKKQFMVQPTSKEIMEVPELFLWGLEARIINIIENYIGLPVAYHGLYFRKDVVNNVKRKSRLWHIDMEDRRMLKIIVYLNDVDDDGGPFQYIPKCLTSFLYRSLRYSYAYLQDQTVENIIPKSDWRACTGKSGTVIIVDPASMFHQGKVPVTADRFTLFFDYTSQQPKHPYYCKSSLPQKDLLILAPSLSQRQKECVFWRN